MNIDCAACGNRFEAQRKTAKYCSPACRKRGSRRPSAAGPPAAPAAPADPVVAATWRELRAAGRLDTALGQQAIRLAEQMGQPYNFPGSALAALSKELRSVMAAVLKTAAPAADGVDEIAERRRRKAAGG